MADYQIDLTCAEIDDTLVHYAQYVCDPAEVDQGAAGNGKTINTYIDAIGTTKNAIIRLRHNPADGNTTNYTLTTSETIPDNIIIKPDIGAIVDGAGTLTINGGVDAAAYKIFGSSITIVFGDGSVPEVYPEWWGARADGSTDSTTALQTAINAIQAMGGGTLVLSNGIYVISSVLSLYQSIILQGKGLWATKIQGTFSGEFIKLVDYGDTYSDIEGVWLKDLTIDGVAKVNGGYGLWVVDPTGVGGQSARQSGVERCAFENLERGIYFTATQAFKIESTKFRNNTYGVYSLNDESGATSGVVQMVYIVDCDFRSNTTGTYATYTSGSKSILWRFVRCHWELNVTGVEVDNIIMWSFSDCKWEQNDSEAVSVDVFEHLLFTNCYFNDNSDVDNNDQIKIGTFTPATTSVNRGAQFINCSWVTGSATYDLKLLETTEVKLTNCQIDETKISADQYSSYIFDGLVLSNSNPNPIKSYPKTAALWIIHSDGLGAIVFDALPAGSTNPEIFIDNIEIQVTEAFTHDGSYVVIQVGIFTSAQYFTQSMDVTTTGIKTVTYNNRGYNASGVEHRLTATLASDGSLLGAGKALVVVHYYDVPPEP